jgi:hypothetical protein
MLTLAAKRSDNPKCAICGDTGWDARGWWRIKRCQCDSGSRPEGRDVKQARGEARQSGGVSRIAHTAPDTSHKRMGE